MIGRRRREEIDSRVGEVRRLLRQRHAAIEPDARFADRVIARLPSTAAWSIDWAARRILPVSMMLAVALMIAVVATGRSAGRATASASISAIGQTEGDLLEWLLERSEGRR